MALRLSGELQKYKQENEALQMENNYLRDSKLALIKATADEIERLRRFISLLANALRGQGFTVKDIARRRDIGRRRDIINKRFMKKKTSTEWKYKQKQKQKPIIMVKSRFSLLEHGNLKHANLNREEKEKEKEKEKEPIISLKERMKALQNKSNKDSKMKEKISALREERNLKAVKVSTASKENIASLFAEKIEKHKKNTRSVHVSLSGAKGKILKEALANGVDGDAEAAVQIVQDLGLFVAREKPPDHRKRSGESEESEEVKVLPLMEVLNMNNNVMMKRMSEKEKGNMENLICDSLIKNKDLKQVQMCNADINDKFLKKILEKLAANSNEHNIKELWLESNPIGDEGIKYLAQFIANDDRIEIVKLYNNKKTISTQVLNELLDALAKNQSIVKFVFDGFRFQHQKDKKERYLRRNTEIARRKRNQQKKRLQALHDQNPDPDQ